MATVSGSLRLSPRNLSLRTTRTLRCSASPPPPEKGTRAPSILKLAVSGATELLRLLSPNITKEEDWRNEEVIIVQSVDDVVQILRSDYENAYFLTGKFTSDIYTEECLFEDPTIKFRGRDRYSQNLDLLVPFFDHPSLELEKIEKTTYTVEVQQKAKEMQCRRDDERSSLSLEVTSLAYQGLDSEMNFVLSKWKLRTHLKFPWRPLISIEGTTTYDLNKDFKIVRHAESWNVSALEALGQIFALGVKEGD